jgi:4-amino-4-deoxy-L-arabinose transferase-like glycosyltransferase
VTRGRTARSDRRHDLSRLIAVAALLFLIQLGARDLWNPNEPIYGQAVAEMSESGEWLIPTVNGEVFAEKPILYFWLARATGAVAGVDELTLRIPSAVSGLVGVVLLYMLVLPYAGRSRARIASALFISTFIVYWTARSVQMDLLVSVTTLGVLLAVTRVIDHGASPRVGWSLAGLAAGLGLLAKGPVGLIVPALVLVVYLAATRRLGTLRWRDLALAAIVCLATAGPWFALLAIRGEWEFLHEVLWRQNVARFIDPWDHQEPWWYYLKYLWIDMAPWAVLLPLAIGLPGRDADEARLDRLTWAWVVSIVVFFSLSASKRSPYILPVAPAVAILAAAPVERLICGTLDRARETAVRTMLALSGGLFLASAFYVSGWVIDAYPEIELPGRSLTLLAAAGGVALLAGTMLWNRWPMAAPSAFAATLLALYLVAGAWALPAANAYKSARPFCIKVRSLVGSEAPLRSYRFWRWRASYQYYSDRTIENIDSPEELRRYWSADEPVWLLVERGRIDEARALLDGATTAAHAAIGSNEIYLLTNR